MTPSEFTKFATHLLETSRAQEHGDFNVGFERAAIIWSVVLGVEVLPHQVALCMVGLKLARSTMNPNQTDNFTDMAGYSGLAGALANAESAKDE